MLAIMPMFHGFGLGVSIHSMVANGGHCILIPRFTAQSYAELIKKHKPNLIAGVPSLVRGPAAGEGDREGRPELPAGRVLRRRQPVRGAEEAVRRRS